MMALRHESNGFVQAPMEHAFAHLDDHMRLSSHMNKASWKMVRRPHGN